MGTFWLLHCFVIRLIKAERNGTVTQAIYPPIFWAGLKSVWSFFSSLFKCSWKVGWNSPAKGMKKLFGVIRNGFPSLCGFLLSVKTVAFGKWQLLWLLFWISRMLACYHRIQIINSIVNIPNITGSSLGLSEYRSNRQV